MRIDPTKIVSWNVATKTRPLKAKPLINLVVDRTVANKFLIDALEGKEPLGDGAVMCVGEAGDAWQQMPIKLLKKYFVTNIDKDGWMECTPLPDNATDCFEVTRVFIDQFSMTPPNKGWFGEFTIIGHYGETRGNEKNVQAGVEGDFLCRNRTDYTDVWIVHRKLFLNTYVIKS